MKSLKRAWYNRTSRRTLDPREEDGEGGSDADERRTGASDGAAGNTAIGTCTCGRGSASRPMPLWTNRAPAGPVDQGAVTPSQSAAAALNSMDISGQTGGNDAGSNNSSPKERSASGGPPRPMWCNLPGTSASAEASASGSSGVTINPPPSLLGNSSSSIAGPPKPMWSNKKPAPSSGLASSESAEMEVETSGPPQPMWTNRKPKNAAVLVSEQQSDSTKSASSVTSVLGRVAANSMYDSAMDLSPSPQPKGVTFLNVHVPQKSSAALNEESSAAEMSIGRPSLYTSSNSLASMDGLSSPSSVKEKPPKYIKNYALGSTLGKGSYAKVKKCTDTFSDTTYAIKVFNKSLLKRRRLWDSEANRFKTAFDDVIREIAIMRKLDHENVMVLKDVIDDMAIDKLYMVMDYCPKGAIMDSHAMPAEPLPIASCRRWFADSVLGLDYLHYQGVVHFDLKPDNILIANDGRAVIADFGVSRIMGKAGGSDRGSDGGLTSGSPGTPSYTAPEVWGHGRYEAKKADVWSLGVTLHAMVFGTLPFLSSDPQELIEMVTAPAEWMCEERLAATLDREELDSLLPLMRGMISKLPEERFSLVQVREAEWVSSEIATRKKKSLSDWKQIEVTQAELRQAIISGHIENFQRNAGSIFKTTNRNEAEMYELFQKSEVSRFLAPVKEVREAKGKRVIIEMEDLTHAVPMASLMDIKMGMRTFTEEDASSTAIRDDLLSKMLKVQPDAAAPEEMARGGITKMRYLEFREQSTTSKALGFRIDAIRLADGIEGNAPDSEELKKITDEEQVRRAVAEYVQGRRTLLASFTRELRELRDTLERCPHFAQVSFIRTSLLFVYSNETNAATVHIIDLSKAQTNDFAISHRSPWEPGNAEDGYLSGLDSMIRIFETLEPQLS